MKTTEKELRRSLIVLKNKAIKFHHEYRRVCGVSIHLNNNIQIHQQPSRSDRNCTSIIFGLFSCYRLEIMTMEYDLYFGNGIEKAYNKAYKTFYSDLMQLMDNL